MNHRFQVVGLREKIDQGHAGNVVVAEELGQIAGESGRIARDDGETARFRGKQGLHDTLAKPGAWWIGEQEIDGSVALGKEILGGSLLGEDAEVCFGSVMVKVTPGSDSGFNCGDGGEALREGKCKETDSRIEIDGGIAFGSPKRFFYECIDEETIDLEKSGVADTKLEPSGGVDERTGDEARNFFGAPIEEAAGDGVIGSQNIELHFCFVGKKLDSAEEVRKPAVGGHAAHRLKRLLQARGRDGAFINGENAVRFRKMIPEVAAVIVKLAAVAIGEVRSSDDIDLFGRLKLSDAAQDFAKDLDFLRGLEWVIGVLVVAATAFTKVFAWRRDPIGRRRFDLFGNGAQHLRAVLDDAHAGVFIRKNEGRHDDLAVITGEAIAAINELFDVDQALGCVCYC